ncbi:MAG: SMC-Scp complex subunit ScpB [Nanoarchaeota archaeon]|nr:SMC-Scp complex subunit ScpB [Nanoarchaeota archaeon]MBU1135801.1 SMC-Scp complex subunit ScpB [Nanoarchaeota archaeon]MBU2520403.1 SMC-Scp complex subunit ScpB [Nanoarchaeota archaeon]
MVNDIKSTTHKKIIEAALFISNQPLMIDELGKIAGINSLGYVKEVLTGLQKEYEEKGMEIVSTQDGWEMQVRASVLPQVAHLTPYSDMPEGCKRSLALIIYKEPITQAEIINIQGNKAYAYLKKLRKIGLIRTERFGRTKKIILTQEFERYFGEEKSKVKKVLSDAVERSIQGKEPKTESKLKKDEFEYSDEPKSKKSARKIEPKKPSTEELKQVFGENNPNLAELDL